MSPRRNIFEVKTLSKYSHPDNNFYKIKLEMIETSYQHPLSHRQKIVLALTLALSNEKKAFLFIILC